MIKEGDGETMYAYFALHKLKIMPWDFVELETRQKATLIAFINEYNREQKAATKKR